MHWSSRLSARMVLFSSPEESDEELMMKRRDLLRSLGGIGAVTAVGHLLDPATAGGQSFPASSDRSAADNLASRLAASIQKHKVPGASAAAFRAGQWEVAAAGVANVTTGVDVTPETVMHIGSITKVLMAQRLLRKSWYTLIEERIFKPLELQHSVVQPADALLHRATVGHFLSKDGTNTRTSFAFLNPSFAPAGATAMLAAKDLATFALAHVNDGVGTNGYRLLSAASARRMRRQTAVWRGIAGGGVGLGWMTFDKGIIGHDGGGPGIASWLFADPAAKAVVAVLTNAAHGVPVLDEMTAPLFEAAGIAGAAKPLGLGLDAAELAKQATDTRVDPHPYVGQYESVALVFRVIPHEEGMALRVRPKLLLYDGDTLEESPPVPLRPIRDGHFMTGQGFVTFLNPGADGRMQQLG